MSQVEQRRNFFPRGLFQQENGFRFSVDSLLLSCFAPVKQGYSILDLGTGCAVIGLALFLHNPEPEFKVTGVDASRKMLDAAVKNAELLALDEFFEPLLLDLRDFNQSSQVEPESFDLVLANPPYRSLDQGRPSPETEKNPARFEETASLKDFIRAGSYALKNKGVFCFVYLAERMPYLLNLLQKFRLEPKRIQFVHGFKNQQARLLLLEARKNGRPGLKIQAPLILYARNEEGSSGLTEQALSFCPFLRANPNKKHKEMEK